MIDNTKEPINLTGVTLDDTKYNKINKKIDIFLWIKRKKDVFS